MNRQKRGFLNLPVFSMINLTIWITTSVVLYLNATNWLHLPNMWKIIAAIFCIISSVLICFNLIILVFNYVQRKKSSNKIINHLVFLNEHEAALLEFFAQKADHRVHPKYLTFKHFNEVEKYDMFIQLTQKGYLKKLNMQEYGLTDAGWEAIAQIHQQKNTSSL